MSKKRARKFVKWLRRIFGVLDTSLTIAILSVSVHWLCYVLSCKYIRIINRGLEYYSSNIKTATYIILVAFSLLLILWKYIKLKRKRSKVNPLWFIGFSVIFIVAIQSAILFLCNKYDVMEMLMNRI
jgi:hypothetical protein